MKVLLATDFRCFIYKGEYYLAPKAYNIFKRYAEAFGEIVLCSRFVTVDAICAGDKKADFIVDILRVNSLSKVLLGQYNDAFKKKIAECDLTVVRLHSIIGVRVSDCARKLNKKYFAECMGDAWDAFWNHGATGKTMAPYMYYKMRQSVRHADYALYVTNKFLQNRYPCNNKSIAASNVFIADMNNNTWLKREAQIKESMNNRLTLMTTAAVNVKYKGQQYVIQAIPKLNKKGIQVKYYIVGEGDNSFLKCVAAECGVEDQVIFTGRMSLEEVFEYLDSTDVYVQPSLQEGLPRSVIEAMSRGCIVVGAKTAGIPELLDSQFVVSRKSVDEIENVLMLIANSSEEEKLRVAKRNFDEAKNYQTNILDNRRKRYYQQIKKEICGEIAR